MSGLAPRAKAYSFGYYASTAQTDKSQIQVGAQEGALPLDDNGPTLKFVKSYFPSKSGKAHTIVNPEEEDKDEKWEEDTTDTEIMKNINSLLDSGKYNMRLIIPNRFV